MTRRVTTKSVVFTSPFVIDETDAELLPGIYTVETEEESLETMSLPSYRRISTILHVNAGGVTRFVTVDPDVLAAALLRDRRAAD
jgi:hypothetical protein